MATYATKTLLITSAGQLANILTSLPTPFISGAWWISIWGSAYADLVVQTGGTGGPATYVTKTIQISSAGHITNTLTSMPSPSSAGVCVIQWGSAYADIIVQTTG